MQDSMAEESILIGRNAPPSHYLFKIQNFSSLSAASIAQFCSGEFDAGGYKWKLCIYPTGNKSKNGKNHISIYLELLQTSSLPAGWEVNVISKFFIFNHSQNKYFSNKDWYESRYHTMNTSCGIAKFIDLNTFSNPVNGYLTDNACVFGVEVFVVQNTLKEEHLSMIIEPATYYHTWKVTNFSTLVEKTYVSESFGCYKWNIILYPNGTVGKGNSISLFLDVSRSSIPLNTKLFVKFILRVKQQKMNGKHIEYKEIYLYSSSDSCAYGFREFISLAKLKDPKRGYLVDDTLIIEAEVTLLGLMLKES